MKSIAEKINLGLFEDFFESLSSANYAKTIINTKNPDENKEFVAEIEDRISNLKDRIKKWVKKKKKCWRDIKNYWRNSWLQWKCSKKFPLASKVDKGKSEPKPEESIAKRVVLRGGKVAKIKREEKKHKQ